MGVGIAVRRRAHPCTRGAWLTLRLLRHAGLAGRYRGLRRNTLGSQEQWPSCSAWHEANNAWSPLLVPSHMSIP
jgi:hypothetical protein